MATTRTPESGAVFAACPKCGRLMFGQRINGVTHAQPHECFGRCPTDECPGDTRYSAPGRGHTAECRYPLDGLGVDG